MALTSLVIPQSLDSLLVQKLLLLVLDVGGIGESLFHVTVRVAALHSMGGCLSKRRRSPRPLNDEQEELLLILILLLLRSVTGLDFPAQGAR